MITQYLEKRIRDDLRRAGGDIRMQFIHPGHVFAQGIRLPDLDFPDDLTVNLPSRKENSLEIEVKKADKTWTLKTNELDRLPEELRQNMSKPCCTARRHSGAASVWARSSRRAAARSSACPGPAAEKVPRPDLRMLTVSRPGGRPIMAPDRRGRVVPAPTSASAAPGWSRRRARLRPASRAKALARWAGSKCHWIAGWTN